ncbi:multicopper oxidase family protein [Methyloterricola oryzae]|uniref:multicopper oxidase family protein n=1 Tax=Methyloterricola oryzae TaxID=1495050 RepID=UPI0005EB75EC|nr:multicopper oxidase domain-containing protein [Methyloterricola oryzae]
MQRFINRSRRRFLSQAGVGLLAYAGLPVWLRAMEGMAEMPKMAPNKASPDFNPDVELDLICRQTAMSILPGPDTWVQQYIGKLVKGPENTLTTLPGSYLGPLMRFRTGQKIRINLRNELEEPTITHWHGLNVPALMDGHPMYALDKGQTFVYEFEMVNRASFILYHPHTHGITGKQVYHGLAGGILVSDEEEAKLGLPSGEYEIPIVIQDRSFNDQNQLVYVRHMHDRMTGFHGDRILVNGRPDVSLDVASRAYRLRIMNGSNARIYKLAWDDNSPMVVLGVDGGLLESPLHKPYVMLGPGERIDVWADFSGRAVGSQLVMRSRPFKGALPKMAEQMMRGEMGGMGGGHGMGRGMGGGGGMGMMGGMMGSKLPLGSDYPIFTVRVTRQVSDSPKLPTQLCTINRLKLEDVANPDKPVPLGISEAPGAMLLNGRPYAPNDFLPSERIPVNTLQLVEIFHAHGGAGGHGGGDAKAAPAGEHGGEPAKPAQEQGGMQHGGGGQGMGMMGHGMGMGMMGGMNHGGGGGDGKSMQQGSGMGGMGGGMGMMGGGMGGGMMMSMAHPIHLHEEPFQILSRSIGAEEADDYATVREGFIDSGWKDTVLVMPGEKVRLIKPYMKNKGVYMVHCHNLEHEDMGMMREFLVE